MKYPPDLQAFRVRVDKEQTIVANSQAKLFSSSQGLYVAFAGFRETMTSGKNLHSKRFAEGTDISLGIVSPKDTLHLTAWNCLISSSVIPSSANTCR